MGKMNAAIHAAAMTKLGVWEWAGAENNPVVVEMYKAAGHPEIKSDGVPWCAAYVGAILAEVGLPNTGSLMARSYTKYGEPVALDDVRRGDIAVLSRGDDPRFGHVAFVDSYNRDNGSIDLLGGNQGDQVNIKTFNANRIVAIRRAVSPRTSLAQSKTASLSLMKAGASIGGGGLSVFTVADKTVQLALIAMFAVIFISSIIVFRDRINSWFGKGNR